ncbi:hypothetical protein PFICI_12950 [Pestalotiopsis fici W106-1]|uniref:S-adenosylmethionine-dependent methyltransferase-like protein n=1 Tax=Pestalotiopsis fici (strain W106-1 / CGMCC3.15140) TaxID=1229662 RepID=W3WT52_PESFW|nr:uncharacterized protein PFICI_12950 [Pestalotiopsis fici W106-1]ETS76006.1 hypothetical protein PFICI_12950 [Pestalotiopsis fici W106-1]
MPSFGRIGRLSNRSQHNLVEQQQQQQQQANALPSLLTSTSSSGFGVGAAGPGSASSASASANTPPSASSTALSSSEPIAFQGDNTTTSSRALTAAAQQQAQQSKQQYQQQQVLLQQQQQQQQAQQQVQLQQQQQFQQQIPPQQHRLQEQRPSSIVQNQQVSPKHQQQPGQPHHYTTTVNYPGSGAPTSNHNPTGNLSNSVPGLDSPATTAITGAAYANLRQQQLQQQQQSSKGHSSDFAESVSRSQSTRYPQTSPSHNQQFFGPASSSVDNLPGTVSSPLIPPSPPTAGPYSHHHQQQHQGPTETKQSTRKLIKKILHGASASKAAASYSSADPRHHQSQPSYDNTSGGASRRPSKRASNAFPPNLRASVSLEQQQIPDWQQSPQQQLSSLQTSPLQDVGTSTDPYSKHHERTLPDAELRLQTPQSQGPQPPRPRPHSSSIRQVPASADYSPEDLAFQQQQQAQAIAQAQQQQQQQQQEQQRYAQVASDSTPSQEQYRQYAHSRVQSQSQVQQGTPPRLYTSHLTSQQSNPETISQLSYDSPVIESDQRSQNFQSTQTSPAVNYPQQERSAPLSQQPASPSPTIAQPSPMAPPSGGPSSRRSGENDKLRGTSIEPPQGPPPNYRHSQTLNTMSSLPPTPGPAQANREFRASNVPDRQAQQQQFDGGNEAGRDSPQPTAGTEGQADPEKQFKDLLTKYKNVKRLYFDGKSQIEQLTSQVEQLQNAVANQRISQSRTALDDSEYATRFNRLNGAINNLAFNIRKDWASLPPWVSGYVSPEAIKTGKQEMTAVGRAVITQWIVDEVFNKCFHPGLDQGLSRHLKEIEHNIRRFSYTLNSQEEFEALTSKVVSWRMATLEGLQHTLQSVESQNGRVAYTKSCNEKLNKYILDHLADPKPAGVEGSVTMIIELAVGIAANLSLESRDVAVTYPLPGDSINPEFMELEKAGLPPLPDSDDGDDSSPDGDKSKREKTKSGMLNLLGGAPPPGSRKSSVVSSTDMDAYSAAASSYPAKDPTKVRFAGFVAVEVRGRQVLVKAPVWNLG